MNIYICNNPVKISWNYLFWHFTVVNFIPLLKFVPVVLFTLALLAFISLWNAMRLLFFLQPSSPRRSVRKYCIYRAMKELRYVLWLTLRSCDQDTSMNSGTASNEGHIKEAMISTFLLEPCFFVDDVQVISICDVRFSFFQNRPCCPLNIERWVHFVA